MGRGGNELGGEALLYGRVAVHRKTEQAFWDENLSRPVKSDDPGASFCLQPESQMFSFRSSRRQIREFKLPEDVKEVEEAMSFNGNLALSWDQRSTSGCRTIGLFRGDGSAEGELRTTTPVPRHSRAYAVREQDGHLFCYVDALGVVHLHRPDSGKKSEGKAAAWRIYGLARDGERNLLLCSSALGKPAEMFILDATDGEVVSRRHIGKRPTHAAMASTGDGTPLVSVFEGDELVVYDGNSPVLRVPDARPLPTEAESSWMIRDRQGDVYVLWSGGSYENGIDIHAARITKKADGSFTVEQRIIGSRDHEYKTVVAQDMDGLFIGLTDRDGFGEPVLVHEVWDLDGQSAEWIRPEGVVSI